MFTSLMARLGLFLPTMRDRELNSGQFSCTAFEGPTELPRPQQGLANLKKNSEQARNFATLLKSAFCERWWFFSAWRWRRRVSRGQSSSRATSRRRSATRGPSWWPASFRSQRPAPPGSNAIRRIGPCSLIEPNLTLTMNSLDFCDNTIL